RRKRKCWLRSALRRLLFVKHQGHLDNSCGDVQAVLSFDRNRLQRDRAVEASHQYVGARADSDRCARGRSAVMTCKCTLAEVGGRGENCPQNHARLKVSDISA